MTSAILNRGWYREDGEDYANVPANLSTHDLLYKTNSLSLKYNTNLTIVGLIYRNEE